MNSIDRHLYIYIYIYCPQRSPLLDCHRSVCERRAYLTLHNIHKTKKISEANKLIQFYKSIQFDVKSRAINQLCRALQFGANLICAIKYIYIFFTLCVLIWLGERNPFIFHTCHIYHTRSHIHLFL